MARGWRNGGFWLLVAVVGVALGACNCGEDPTQNRLKREGEACRADDECETGLCNELPGQEAVCLRKCSAGCVQNEICSALAPARFACVLEKAGLCEPCAADSDCPYPGDKCLSLGSERFCGRDCSFDGTCPASYRCTDGVGLQGELLTQQCQPVTGTCECTAASAGQQKPCVETNTFGTCMGVRTCVLPAGFGACSAPVPSEEVCNGLDDDCNAQTDEGMGELSCGVGECARTVLACADGVPQSCQPGDPGVEVCDEKDNDCDGATDEDFDLDDDLAHCGACNALCDPPHATGACANGTCSIAQCDSGWWDRDLQVPNGCEYPCALTNGGVEICDGLDNDCDTAVDEGFDLNSDPNHCGVCNLACTPPHAQGACVAKQCAVGLCNAGRADCNQQYPDGCEIDTDTDLQHCGGCGQLCSQPNATAVCASGQCGIGACLDPFEDCTAAPGCETNTDTSVAHCGTCGNACTFPNATPTCTSGACGFACLPNFWDLDGNPANGCEYACSLVSASVDLPDLAFVDANCDGIDGELGNAIFVAPSAAGGNDANPGTRAQPKATIAAGVSAAVAANRRDVYVAAGTFVETVNVAAGKGVYGGYQMGTWTRGFANVVTVTGTNPPLLVENAPGSAAQLLSLLGTSATTPGASSYGVIVRNSSGVTLEGLTISAGSGADGLSGGAATPGQNGSPGNPGQVGCESDGLTCDSCNRPNGGTGGPSSCGRTGGSGGNAGLGGSTGSAGGSGAGSTPGGAGVPAERGNVLAPPNANGVPGANGSIGSNGSSGGPLGSFNFSGYVAASSLHGGNGTHGNGGGGGGGGGGGTQFCDSYGSGGGGGGAGGCGGQGGRRGESGGASIGVYLYNSSVTASSLSITTGNGGRGGNASAGGSGGTGGNGGNSPYGSDASQDDGSRGGFGGKGGNGGNGGAGGAGGGGPSLGIVRAAGASWNPVGAVNVTLGNAGSGGSSPGGTAGATGLRQALY